MYYVYHRYYSYLLKRLTVFVPRRKQPQSVCHADGALTSLGGERNAYHYSHIPRSGVRLSFPYYEFHNKNL